MADNLLDRVHFLLYERIVQPGENKTAIGYAYCRRSVARFLDIEDKASALLSERTVKASSRSLTLADGTKLESEKLGAVREHKRVGGSLSANGKKTIVLHTNQIIVDTKAVKNKKSRRHSLRFRFPAFAGVVDIADFLAETIPATKFGTGASEIRPFFSMVGGRKYPIMISSAAVAREGAESVPPGTLPPAADSIEWYNAIVNS
jgi:hypothetical protein